MEVELRPVRGQWEGEEAGLVVLVVPPEVPGGWAGPGSWREAPGNDNKTVKLSSYIEGGLKYYSNNHH